MPIICKEQPRNTIHRSKWELCGKSARDYYIVRRSKEHFEAKLMCCVTSVNSSLEHHAASSHSVSLTNNDDFTSSERRKSFDDCLPKYQRYVERKLETTAADDILKKVSGPQS